MFVFHQLDYYGNIGRPEASLLQDLGAEPLGQQIYNKKKRLTHRCEATEPLPMGPTCAFGIAALATKHALATNIDFGIAFAAAGQNANKKHSLFKFGSRFP